MESHPLNLAHQQQRRAEAHLKHNRYDEAMQCHQNAAELLLDAMKSTTSSVARESITLQHSYHLKQKDVIKSKKEQYARVKKAVDNIKLLGKNGIIPEGKEYTKVEVAIYRAINETDSLLQNLLEKDNLFMGPTKEVITGKKIAKNKEMVVEELQTLGHDLKSLVEKLITQIEVLKDENEVFKEKIIYLEKERVKFFNLNIPYPELHISFDPSFAQKLNYQTRPTNAANVEKPVQQPNFDLSSFKNN